VARFKWHADFFEGCSGVRAAKSTIIEANNTDESEKLATAALGAFGRVETRRVGTAAPVRVILLSASSTTERTERPRQFGVWAPIRP
jgi:hypothetical protein